MHLFIFFDIRWDCDCFLNFVYICFLGFNFSLNHNYFKRLCFMEELNILLFCQKSPTLRMLNPIFEWHTGMSNWLVIGLKLEGPRFQGNGISCELFALVFCCCCYFNFSYYCSDQKPFSVTFLARVVTLLLQLLVTPIHCNQIPFRTKSIALFLYWTFKPTLI